ncbi:MAG: RecQ family zinc-binding domain-containing protein, partial [Mucilaginibacter sp.]
QQTDQPQVTYIRPRLQNNELIINKRYIEERKIMFKKKMEAVFAYAEHRKCRSQMLLAYFDENDADKCGICDVCLEEKRQRNLSETADNITDEIAHLLTADNLTIDELISSLKIGTEKDRIETIRLLLDAGKIKTDGERYYL